MYTKGYESQLQLSTTNKRKRAIVQSVDALLQYIDMSIPTHKTLSSAIIPSLNIREGRDERWRDRGGIRFGHLIIGICLSSLLCLLSLSVSPQPAVASVAQSRTLRTNPNLRNGLVGWWTMDGPDTLKNIVDRSSSFATGSLIMGSSGTLTATTSVPGRLGQALQFDGNDDAVRIFSPTPLNLSGEMSIFAWVKKSAAQSKPFVAQSSGGGTAGQYKISSQVTGNKFTGSWGSYVITSNSELSNNTWYFVGWTRAGISGSWTVNLYLNGRIDKTDTTATDPPIQRGFSIAANGDASGSNFNGAIDDVRIYNYVLATSTIKRIYDLGATTKISKTLVTNPNLETGLVGHWTFDGPDALKNVVDRGTAYATGPLIMGSSGTLTATATMPGRLGQSLKFDGTDDYVTLGSLPALDQNNAMSISAWIKPSTVAAGEMDVLANSDGTNKAYRLSINNTAGKTRCVWASTAVVSGNLSLVANTWQHVVLVRSGSSGAWTCALYLNGVFDAAGGTANNPDGTNQSTSIGREGSNSSRYFSGAIDDVRLYNYAISTSTIQRLYDMGR